MIGNARPPARQMDLPRWCRCEDGTPKKWHPSRKAARDYARQYLGPRRFVQYHCKACEGYHNATGRSA